MYNRNAVDLPYKFTVYLVTGRYLWNYLNWWTYNLLPEMYLIR